MFFCTPLLYIFCHTALLLHSPHTPGTKSFRGGNGIGIEEKIGKEEKERERDEDMLTRYLHNVLIVIVMMMMMMMLACYRIPLFL